MKEKLQTVFFVVVLTVVVIGGLYIDYSMFQRSHPSAGYFEYLWERGSK